MCSKQTDAEKLIAKDLSAMLRTAVVKDIKLTSEALEKLRVIAPEKSYMRKIATDFITMAKSYYMDAKYFYERDELVKALSCINYAHGWIDAGARLGIFDVGGNSKLFTLAE